MKDKYEVKLTSGELSSLLSILYDRLTYCCIGDDYEDENDQNAKILYQKFLVEKNPNPKIILMG